MPQRLYNLVKPLGFINLKSGMLLPFIYKKNPMVSYRGENAEKTCWVARDHVANWWQCYIVNVHLGIVTYIYFSFLGDPKGTIKRMNHHRGIML
jgi:hypothetical protein